MLESLESRRLLAGNVTVTLAAGLATITGDNKSNQLEIVFDANTFDLSVGGLSGTTVNGGTAPVSIGIAGVKGETGNGDDLVKVHSINGGTVIFIIDVPDGGSIETGNGADVVAMDRLAFSDTNISTGNGADVVHLSNVAGNNLNVDTGNGADA